MDFHLGSGITCAVAHKMGWCYIGIEQMDYIEDIAVERMKKVIGGEQGGISKSVEWSGGGSFVYAELKEIENFKESEIPICQLHVCFVLQELIITSFIKMLNSPLLVYCTRINAIASMIYRISRSSSSCPFYFFYASFRE